MEVNKQIVKISTPRSKTTQIRKKMPLICWDIFIEMFGGQIQTLKKEEEKSKILSLGQKFNWVNDMEALIAQNDYEALIITDKNQKIIWVNDGFSTMTGFDKKYAINKTPRFLQGEKTSPETKSKIKKKLQLNTPFKEVIINHRKDKSTYKCEVKIVPLKSDKTTHFMGSEGP